MTATHTAPRTWATGEIVTAAQLNEQLRDNLDYLKARQVLQYTDQDGSVATTTSGSFTNITAVTKDITTQGSSSLLITVHLTVSHSTVAVSYFTVTVDGVNQGNSTYGLATVQNMDVIESISFGVLTASVSDGAHTVNVQYKTNAATLTVRQAALIVMEVL